MYEKAPNKIQRIFRTLPDGTVMDKVKNHSTTGDKIKESRKRLQNIYPHAYRGLAAQAEVPPMNRLYTVPRKEGIKDWWIEYPKKRE